MRRTSEIRLELERAEKAVEEGNSGRARVSARRAAGIALEEYYAGKGKNPGQDAVKLLATFSEEKDVPKEIREAAYRLHARVRPDFTSASEDPMADARAITDYLTNVG